jgi:hypothetical protein
LQSDCGAGTGPDCGLAMQARRSAPCPPHAWKDRKVVFPSAAEMHLPPPSHNDLGREGLTVIEEPGPTPG